MHIINNSFVTGVVPDNLKIAKIIPIYKSGNINVFNNYRPISILPTLSKIMEKIVCNRLVIYLEKYNILYKHQYGFRSKHSTIHPILHLLKDIADANDKTTKDITLAVFLDLSKAFDTINHDILLYKLNHYGIRGISNRWFASYLSNRKQYIEINNCKSPLINMTHGVPQGSILGPVLFLIYINDIVNSSSLNLLSFADDTTVYYSGYDIEHLVIKVNQELKQLYNWLCANKLCLNVKKTHFCVFSPVNSNYEVNNSIKINNEVINQVGKYKNDESVKFLGLYIDKHLTWKEHINIISSKISRAIFAINRVKYFLPYKSLKSLYYVLIHSHITYGIQAWGNGNTKKIEILQKRALRIINKKGYRSHTDPLFKSDKILKVSDVYKLQVSLFMYDFKHDLLPKSFTNFAIKKTLDKSIRITRQCNLLVKETPRTHFSSKLPKHNFTRIWNNINEKIRNTKHRLKFRRVLCDFYLNAYLRQVNCINPRCSECNETD